MATFESTMKQAGYGDDGWPVSFGAWANAWSPAWESFPAVGTRRQADLQRAGLRAGRDADPACDPIVIPLWSEA